MKKIIVSLLVVIWAVTAYTQVTDTLKYYYPFDPDNPNTLAFVEECLTPGYCEPLAVWFTPDSSLQDSTMKYYSIKTIRFCFAGNIYEDTTFTVHLGDSFPDATNQVYKRHISVDVSETNQNFLNDGIYKFKDFDVEGVAKLKNICINTSFWVVLQNKVWALYNTTYEPIIFIGSYHSFYNGLPELEWIRLPGDWIVEAVIEYHKVLSIEEPNTIGEFPKKAQLFQNFPNPFNALESSIKYQIYQAGFVSLEIYTNTGKKVKTLVHKNQRGGVYNVKFNLKDMSSGVYFYVLKINGEQIDSRKMTFIK